jgi:hypothetical protein
VFDPLVFASGAFPVPVGTEDSIAKEAAFLGIEGPIINCLGVLNFPLAPGTHCVAGSDPNRDLIKADGALLAD